MTGEGVVVTTIEEVEEEEEELEELELGCIQRRKGRENITRSEKDTLKNGIKKKAKERTLTYPEV
jgi:hypothetical protein